MTELVLLSNPRVADLPAEECGEPLVDLREFSELALDDRQADPAGAYLHLRAGVVERLLVAQGLLPDGVRLLIVEGYRPLWLQERYFAEYANALREDNPLWTDDFIRVQASRYISPPEIAPHVSGAAIDLTLCTESGRELDMGTEVNASPEESDNACYTDADVSPLARGNRRMLVRALETAGLVNYPTEWWHWSYGDRYWAMLTGARAAKYEAQDMRF
ncbi:M15 family metallopeptidase [Umezawaea sp. Da 62-37]|uniref:M15 family metallopeptidase n=1 Tax=Umezawaea sp. Da 62-37 TaxID=3075927 RepID=UPI0028F6D0A5|nr:M15 family metallopeptidase [Umezawaea sp. Da 62-37]WNV91085.1 M15 family metallopeptidase [Umezawaea sp. Da 62-37]